MDEDAKLITDYVGATFTATCEAFTNTPAGNDTFEIQAYCGKVQLLEGQYICDDSILVKSGVKLEGQGVGTLLKVKDATDVYLIRNSGYTGAGNAFIEIHNFNIDGNKQSGMANYRYGVLLEYCQGYSISNLYISNYNGISISASYSNNGTIEKCIMNNGVTQYYGISLIYAHGVNVANNIIKGSDRSNGVYLYHSIVCNILGNTLTGCAIGMNLAYSDNNNISNNSVSYSLYDGIKTANSNSNTISANTVIESGKAVGTYSNILIDSDSNYNNIQNNTLRSAASGSLPAYGIRINNANCDKNICSSNDCIDAGVYGTASLSDAGTSTVKANNRT